MAGLGIIIPRTGGTGPIVEDDATLTHGSLMLLDPSHSAQPWAAGVPADGSAVPNLAASKAKALIIGASESDLGGIVYNKGFTGGAAGSVERTGRGGLHVISPSTVAVSQGNGFAITPSMQLRQYLFDNRHHDYYFSLCFKLTRREMYTENGGAGHLKPALAVIANMTSFGNNYVFRINPQNNQLRPANSSSVVTYQDGVKTWLGQTIEGGDNTVGNGRRAIGSAGYTSIGASPVDITSMGGLNAAMFATGAPYRAAADNGASLNVGGNDKGNFSAILYRAYLEDLTVSGRTYETVDALESQAYVQAMSSRYSADTHTDPATIA